MGGTNPYTMASRATLREAPPQTQYWAGLRGSMQRRHDQEHPPAGDSRRVGPDVLRAVAIFLVVVIHTSSSVVNAGPAQGFGRWWTGNLFDSFARSGVPLFVLLSGWMLLTPERRHEPIAAFLWRRGQRIVLPLITWSALAYAWLGLRDHRPAGWARFGAELLNGPVYFHLWYVYILLGLYLAIPLLRPLAAESSRSVRWYALGLWFVGTALLPLWEWWGGPHVGIPVLVVSTYVGYLLAGTWLAGTPVTTRTRWQLLLLIALTGGWTAAATARLTGGDEMNVALYAYDRPNVLVMSVALFVLLTQPEPAAWLSRHPKILGITRAVAATSFGVYLVHPLLLDVLGSGVLGYRLTAATVAPLVGIPLLSMAVLAVSVALMLVLRRIPFLGKALGA
jgi:surface polysaccharide O-acyltransferase-like enzyme